MSVRSASVSPKTGEIYALPVAWVELCLTVFTNNIQFEQIVRK